MLPSPVASTSAVPAPTRSASKRPSSPSLDAPPFKRLDNPHSSSSKSARTTVGTGAAGCRLVWRGAVQTSEGKAMHGVAIVAHLFTVPHLSPFQTRAEEPSPFDDPFSPFATGAAGADMCLGLEMMRGGDLKVRGEVQFALQGALARDSRGKSREDAREDVMVETPTDLRVYIDPRCPATVDWFETMFCSSGRERLGVRIDVGGEELIIFPSHPPSTTSSSPGAAGASVPSRPPLTLSLGRASAPKVRRPRPDDPMPRESLFTSALRRTASLPVLAFNKKKKPLVSATSYPTIPPPRPSTTKARVPLERSSSVASGILGRPRASSKAKPPTKLKDDAHLKPRGRLQRGKSQALLNLLDGERRPSLPLDTEETWPVGGDNSFDMVPGSPTPSMLSIFGGEDAEERKPVVPTEIEVKNRAAVRKIVLARLLERGVGREDPRFKDTFSMTSKGVQFALRNEVKLGLIDRDRATRLADGHILMYIEQVTTLPPTVADPATLVMHGGGLPSPRSLDTGVVEGEREGSR